MSRSLQLVALTLAIAAAANDAAGFALLGPTDPLFQTAAIGYNPLGTDIGGPMNLGEEYRWNLTTITYAFDPSFVNYFGQKGVQEVNKAIAVLNKLRPMSALSQNLTEFQTDTRRINYDAYLLDIIDLKSAALAIMLEEMGMASPERYVWTLRDKRPLIPATAGFQYLVIQRNFDPVTLAPSAYVNGTLYTYAVVDPIPVLNGTPFADAQEVSVDPLDFGFTAVVSAADDVLTGFGVTPGQFFTGITRDDAGSLRYLYAGRGPRANLNVEPLPTGVTTNTTGINTGSPWALPGSGSGTIVSTALRPGVNKIIFKQAKFDSMFGTFITVSNLYTDTYVTSNHFVTQRLVRVITQPDILFAAADIGLDSGGDPTVFSRSANFLNNSGLNGTGPTAGPGIIQPQIVITFNKVGPFLVNQTPSFLRQETAASGWVWGSYDATTNSPTVYPIGTSIEDLVRQVFSGQ